jgi:hypothetical protein
MSKKRLFVGMVLVNFLLGVLFVISNYSIWDKINAEDYSSPDWNPISVSYVPRDYVNGELIYALTIVFLTNYPFWLFWVAMILNILFGFFLLKNKETEASTT